jgi:hypothetical protein
MSQVFQPPGTSIGTDSLGFQVGKKGSTFKDQVVCSCRVDPAHKKDAAGCGYGKGLDINIPMPA